MTKFLYSNIRGLLSNFDSLCCYLQEIDSPDVILLTETFLSTDVPDSAITIPNYTIHRKDRLTHGGGLVIYCNINLPLTVQPTYSNSETESLWFNIILPHSKLVGCLCYRPPGPDFSLLDHINETLSTCMSDPNEIAALFGDFNGHCHDWCESAPTTIAGRKILEFSETNDFSQLISQPTRYSANSPPTLLDNIFTDQPDVFCAPSVSVPIGTSDHAAIAIELLSIGAETPTVTDPKFRYDWKRANWTAINTSLASVDWSKLDDFHSIDDCWKWLKDEILSACSIQHSQRKCFDKSKVPWFNSNIQQAITARNYHWSQYKRAKTEETFQSYISSRNKCKSILRASKAAYYTRCAKALVQRSNSRSWYKLASRLYRGYSKLSSVPPLKSATGTVVRNPVTIANRFNEHFTRFPPSVGSFPNFLPRTGSLLTDVQFTEQEVLTLLNSLNTAKATGPDMVPNVLLRQCSFNICKPLTKLFNKSMSCSALPKEWKHARVSPVYKGKGGRDQVNNYRPISITSNVGKVLESLVNRRLLSYLIDNKLITEKQFGFLPKHSTTDQIILILQKWLSHMENNKYTIATFLDLSSAFDSVSHRGILHKLPSYGIRGHLLAWIENYLQDRSQTVTIETSASTVSPVKSGVPQGSGIAPILFIIYINDLADQIPATTDGVDLFPLLFADDTLLSCSADSARLAAHRTSEALKHVAQWAKDWKLTFNAAKTKVMLVSSGTQIIQFPNVYFQNQLLEFVDHHKHLGFILTSDLRLHRHVQYLASCVAKDIFLLRRLAGLVSDKQLLLNIYKAYIRPKLEYASPALVGVCLTDSDFLEAIQRKSMRVILGLPYRQTITDAHYSHLNLDKLCLRRIYASACYGYKLFNNLTPKALAIFRPQLKQSSYNLRRLNFFIPDLRRTPTSRYCKAPVCRIIAILNQMNELVLGSECLNQFRSVLNQNYNLLNNALSRR